MLPKETERVWNFIREQPALAGFILIGGTALAFRIKHRRSDDLDLAFPEVCLPRAQLDAFLRVASQSGFHFEPDDDEAAVQEFAFGGMELHDYQQNFVFDGSVRVSFFVPNVAVAKVLTAPPESRVRVATLVELFKTKCLVCGVRSKTRDWLDVYLLLREHGFSMRDFREAFHEAGVDSQCDTALSRLCSGVPQRDDEGYSHLLENAPSLLEMKTYFIGERNLLEVELAAEAARRRRGADGRNG